MKRLFLFELQKLKKQKSLYICSAVIVAMLLLTVLADYIMYCTFGIDTSGGEPTAVTSMLKAISASDFTLIASIFIVIYVCADYSQKTIKNMYSRGFSRTEVFFVKYIICVAYIIIMYAVSLLFTLAVGSAFFGFKTVEGHVFWSLFGQLLVCIAYVSFVFAICNMVKSMGISLAIVIAAPMALAATMTVIDFVIILRSETFNEDALMVSGFWLDGMLSTLSSATANTVKTVLSNVLPVVYGAGFVTLGYLINRKTEV